MSSTVNLSIQASPRVFELLRDLVHERMGLYFEDAQHDMFVDKLSPLVVKACFDSLLDYYYFLKYDRSSADEWGKLFEALTVQESFFWREMDQIRALVDEIVPHYFTNHPHHTLHIWSAACAAGEEPLTIAMALDEAGWFNRARIEIHASDANPRAVEASRKGVYRERSFRSLPPGLKERYFVCEDGLWHASSELHSKVQWRIANLTSVTDVALAAITSPVVYCRNVLIYFSESSARKTVRLFAEWMPRPGYLFVGAAESLLKLTSDFELREVGGAFVYVKS
jgi:chemotaxis protein methyltransferase CheR